MATCTASFDRVGARCLEVETNHRARKFGQTKYGIGRTFRVVLDLITVCYMQRYFSKPMRLFGAIGLWMALFALLGLTATAAMKLGWNQDMTGNPMLILSMILAVMSVQFFSLGLIGEVSGRIYFGQRDHCSYHVRRLVNFDRAHTLPNPHEQDSHRDHRRAA